MPILEYVCKTCDHQFETIKLGPQDTTCPVCQGTRLERLFSVFAVGGQSSNLAAREPFGPCGTCGDPRGAGACAMD